ncbi:hypothetical protein ACVWXL_006709 [Bradyrhizobium sp. GM22.5]
MTVPRAFMPSGRDCRLRPQRGRRHYLGVLAQRPSIRRQRKAVGGTRHQPGAELGFQRRNLAADGGMAAVQPARRAGEAAGIGDREEGLAKVPVHERPLFKSEKSSVQY